MRFSLESWYGADNRKGVQMKVLAIIDVKPGVDLESLREQFVGAGLLHVELIELRPFVNWSALFAR
jgi:hypothetical protein